MLTQPRPVACRVIDTQVVSSCLNSFNFLTFIEPHSASHGELNQPSPQFRVLNYSELYDVAGNIWQALVRGDERRGGGAAARHAPHAAHHGRAG